VTQPSDVSGVGATSLIMLGIAVFGVVAYRSLAVSDLPNVDFPR